MSVKTKLQLEQELEQLRQRVRELESQTQAEELTVLQEMAVLLSAGLDIEGIFDKLYHYILRLLDTDTFYVALYDAEKEELFFALDVAEGQRISAEERQKAGHGLTEYVIRSGQPLLIKEDIPGIREQLGIQAVGKQGALSWLGVPMIVDGRVIGMISVQSYAAPRKYNEHHRDLLSVVASNAAVAIEKTRLSQQRARQLAEMRALNDIGQVLSGMLDLEQILTMTYQVVGQVLDTTNFYIAMYDAARNEWEDTFRFEHGEWVQARWRKVGFGLTSHIIQSKEVILLRTQADIEAFLEAQGTALVGEMAKSWMGVPLITGGELIGVMVIQSYTDAYAYDESDQAFFMTVAAQVANAIQKGRLFEQTRMALDQTQALYQVGRSMMAVEDLETVFQGMVNRVAETLPADRVTLITFNLEAQVVEHFLMGGPGVKNVVRAPFAELWEGLSGWVLREKRPALSPKDLPDPRESAEVQRRRVETACGSILVTPILYRNTPVGTLTAINRPEQRDFTEQDVDLLLAIANQVLLALESHQMVREREQKAAEMELLNQMGQELSKALTMEEVLETTYRQVGRKFDAVSFYIALYQEGSTEWRLAFNIEDGVRQPPKQYTMGQGLTSHIIQSRHPLFFRSEREYLAFLDSQGFEHVGSSAKSWMGVPLIASNEVVGVMGIESYHIEGLYSEHDLAFFYAIAAQVANAVQNARLLNQFQVQAANERRARTITARIRQAPDAVGILRVAAETLREALGASTVVVRLGTQAQLLAEPGAGGSD